MNELKMRKLFTRIFGMGIYDYFQPFRMIETARLMREEKLSVLEAGYQIGFENLSHFSRVPKSTSVKNLKNIEVVNVSCRAGSVVPGKMKRVVSVRLTS